MLKSYNKKTIFYISITILFSIVMFLLSSQTSLESNDITKNIIRFIFNPDNKKQLEVYNYVFRKIIHFSEFFILYILLYNFIKNVLSSKNIKHIILISLIICIIFAFGDEFHQIFVSGRTPRFWDILIDICGALLGNFIILLKNRNKKA